MSTGRLMSAARAAGCVMAPAAEDLDGVDSVMPRADLELAAREHQRAGTALAVSWQEPALTARIKDLVGSLWYGRATPA